MLYFIVTVHVTGRNTKLRREANEKDIEQEGIRDESLTHFETVKVLHSRFSNILTARSISPARNTNSNVTEVQWKNINTLIQKVLDLPNAVSSSGRHFHDRFGDRVHVFSTQNRRWSGISL